MDEQRDSRLPVNRRVLRGRARPHQAGHRDAAHKKGRAWTRFQLSRRDPEQAPEFARIACVTASTRSPREVSSTGTVTYGLPLASLDEWHDGVIPERTMELLVTRGTVDDPSQVLQVA